MTREKGTIGEYLAACVGVLMLTVLLFSYMDSVALIQKKGMISQIARKYILIMESKGYLTEADSNSLLAELEIAGLTDVRLDGTSFTQVGYGNPIILLIRGYLEEDYELEERKVSTAKN